MNNILMISYLFPPCQEVGAKRSWNFFTDLKDHGYRPYVFTNKWGSSSKIDDVYEISHLDLHIIADIINWICDKIYRLFRKEYKKSYGYEFFIPDMAVFWIPGCLARAFRIVRKNDIKLFYVSCSPFSAAITGYLLKLIFKRPLVLDFRDVWVHNPAFKHIAVHRFFIRLFEKLVLSRTDCLIVNCKGAAEIYRKEYKGLKVVEIPNGIDASFLNAVRALKVSASPDPEILKIGYFGKFFTSHRMPDLLIKSLGKLKDEIRFKFYITIDAASHIAREIERLASESGILDRIVFLPVESGMHEMVRKMYEMDVLYLKQGFECVIGNHVPIAAKTYEYLVTGIPILVESPNGDQVDIIKTCSANSYIVTEDSEKIMTQVLQLIYKRFRSGELKRQAMDAAMIDRFDYAKLTGSLAKEFDLIVR